MSVDISSTWSTYIPDLAGTDDVLVYLPRNMDTAGKTPIIYCHGFLGSPLATGFRTSGEAADYARGIASLGHPVAISELTGFDPWGRDSSVTDVDEQVTGLNTRYGTRTDKVGFLADSAGALTVFAWMHVNPTKFAGAALIVPVVNFVDFHTRNPATQASIEAAYGGLATWTAELPTHDPSHANLVASTIPHRNRISVFAMDQDEAIPKTVMTAWSAATGVRDLRFLPGVHGDGYDHSYDQVCQSLVRWL